MKYSDRDDREGADPNGQPVEVLHWAAAIDDTGTFFLLLCHRRATKVLFHSHTIKSLQMFAQYSSHYINLETQQGTQSAQCDAHTAENQPCDST